VILIEFLLRFRGFSPKKIKNVQNMTGYEGQAQVTVIFVMPEKYRARVTKLFREMHKPFLKETHAALGLQHYAVTIDDELSNPWTLSHRRPDALLLFSTRFMPIPTA
jgi:hypothetical protein